MLVLQSLRWQLFCFQYLIFYLNISSVSEFFTLRGIRAYILGPIFYILHYSDPYFTVLTLHVLNIWPLRILYWCSVSWKNSHQFWCYFMLYLKHLNSKFLNRKSLMNCENILLFSAIHQKRKLHFILNAKLSLAIHCFDCLNIDCETSIEDGKNIKTAMRRKHQSLNLFVEM